MAANEDYRRQFRPPMKEIEDRWRMLCNCPDAAFVSLLTLRTELDSWIEVETDRRMKPVEFTEKRGGDK